MASGKDGKSRRGTNLPLMGDFNQRVILDTIRRSTDGLSRVEVAKATGLSAQTISNICRRLLEQDLIAEVGKEISGPGKPRTILRLNPAGLYAAGVHIDPAVVTFVILDFTGKVAAHSTRQTPPASDPDATICFIADNVAELIESSGIDRQKLLGLGVAAPGPLDSATGTIVDAPLLPGWRRVPLRDGLAAATGLPVLVDKDVTAAAVAEMWAGGPSGMGSFVFFYLGTGIGAGLVLRDEVLRGSSDNAGEIGHIIGDPDGPDCFCGMRGCIAVSCLPQNLVAEAIREGVLEDVRFDGEAQTVDGQFTKLCALAESGNAAAAGIIDRSAMRIAKAVSVLTNVLDLDRVVFGGPFWRRLSKAYFERIPDLLDSMNIVHQIHKVTMVGTGVGEDVGAVGAACLVLEQAYSPSSQRLLLEADRDTGRAAG